MIACYIVQIHSMHITVWQLTPKPIEKKKKWAWSLRLGEKEVDGRDFSQESQNPKSDTKSMIKMLLVIFLY